MQQKIIYIADDGTEWDTEETAAAQDKIVEEQKIIDQFLESREFKKIKTTEYRNIITDYLRFRQG